MQSSHRSRSWIALLLGALLLSAPTAVFAADAATPVYVLDLTHLHKLNMRDAHQARTAWDTLHLVASLQGLVNRDAANLFVRFEPQPDDFWFDYLRGESGWLSKRPVLKIDSLEKLLTTFQKQVRGIVVYNDSVRATSNLASTIAGIEGRICLHHDDRPDSVFGRVMAAGLPFTKHRVDLFNEDGSALFTAANEPGTPVTIRGTTFRSSGSAKCDAYLWAKQRYLETGRASSRYMAYYIDSYWLTDPAQSSLPNSTLANHDFFIANQAFFFDLHMWAEETPVDDRQQRPGTDVRTLKALMKSMHRRADGKIFHIGGFVPWAWKYTNHGRAGSQHGGVDSEWEYGRIISAYNGMMDADAIGISGMTNASFYQHFPLRKHYPQHPRPTVKTLKKKKLIQPDGRVAPHCYVCFYMGDYDSAAWLTHHVPKWWTDPARGAIPCGWAFNANLDRRAPHVMHYARMHASKNDWFVSGDNGAGYLNPGMLTAPRLDPEIPDGWDAWITHNRAYYKKYDLSITGFIIDGHAPGMGKRGLDAYALFSPDGIVGQKLPAHGLHGKMPFVRMATDLGGSPQTAGERIAAMVGVRAPRFRYVRTILKSPTWHQRAMQAARAAEGGENLRFVDPYTFFTLLKTYERNKAAGLLPASRFADASELSFTAPRDSRGISPVAVADGPFQRGMVDGHAALKQSAGKNRYLYFETDPGFAADISPDSLNSYSVSMRLHDQRAAMLVLEYDSHDRRGALDGAYTSAKPVKLTGSGKWVTVRFSLPRARLAARQNGGANFRLINPGMDLVIHRVALDRSNK